MGREVVSTSSIATFKEEWSATPLLERGLAMLAVLAIATLMNCFQLDQEGLGNRYYAATVRSMLTGWHEFFYASFDPGGFVSVDKPPLGFWIQAASAKLFGFGGLSLLLPQAVAGIIATAVIVHLVARAYGSAAGVLAGLIFALTPIAVAINRDNTIDSLLLLALLAAAWALSQAIESRRHLHWLLVAAGLVGLGFNIKMGQAYLPLPSLWLVYLVLAPVSRLRRVLHLAVATVVLLVISLSWAVVVDRTPPDQRPYIGSSSTNSVWNLIVEHNGLERLLGPRGLFAQGGRVNPPPTAVPAGARVPLPDSPAISDQAGAQPGLPDPLDEAGPPGPLRLFNEQLAGQISWLLSVAGLGLLVAAWQARTQNSTRRARGALLLWGAWLLIPAVFFGATQGIFHRYYLATLAPPIAALAGIGIMGLLGIYRSTLRASAGPSHLSGGVRAVLGISLLPAAFLGTAVVQWWILAPYPDWQARLGPAILGLSGIATLVLISWGTRCLVRRQPMPRGAYGAVAVGVLALLMAPAVWSALPVMEVHARPSPLPAAGPASPPRFVLVPGVNPGLRDLPAGPITRARLPGVLGSPEAAEGGLIRYLAEHHDQTRFLVATISANEAAPFILATGLPVMAMGGFSGRDPILTRGRLASLVEQNDVRYFLLPSGDRPRPPGPPGPGPRANNPAALEAWVTEHCRRVPAEQWQPVGGAPRPLPPPLAQSPSARPPSLGFGAALFDCGPGVGQPAA